MRKIHKGLSIGFIGLSLVGCGGDGQSARPLTPSDFIDRPVRANQGVNPLDQPGPVHYDQVGLDLMDPRNRPAPETQVDGVSRTVVDAVKKPEDASTTGPTTRPSVSSGQYLTIGGVVAEVNRQPIFANKVIKALEPPLAARAKELDAEQFQKVATELVYRQINEFVRAELEFAAADKSLSGDEKRIADMMTAAWRDRQISEAGGSVEMAKKRSAANGDNFDQLVDDQYRLHMTQVYYQKKVIPKIQVTAYDLRTYYESNKSRMFSQQDAASFRIIKIDVKKSGGREAALKKAQDLREKAVAGQDFAELARTNDSAAWQKSGGDPGGPIQKGAWANEKVEEAIWATETGAVTDVIDIGDAFFLAKIEDRKMGSVQPFEDPVVQDRIRETLRSEQFRKLRDAEQKKLEDDAFIRIEEPMVATAIEMVMQRYPGWHGDGKQ